MPHSNAIHLSEAAVTVFRGIAERKAPHLKHSEKNVVQ